MPLLAAVEHGGGRLDAAVGVALVGEQEEFELEGAGRMQALRGEGVDLARQRMARVGGHRRAVEMVHRHQHLAARRAGAVQRLQRAGDRPGAQVAVAGIPDQAGLVDILAGDVEAEDRDRQMPAVLVEASSSWRRMILPRPTPLASVSTMSKASMSGCASRKALALRRAWSRRGRS